jgi:spore coat protein U-like protein
MHAWRHCRTTWLVAAMAACALWVEAGRADAACTVTVNTNLAFGTYNIFSPAALDTTGRFNVRCTRPDRNATLHISLSRGNTGTYAERRLTSGVEFLLYNLYLDAARTIVWGDGTGGSQAYTGAYPGSRQYFNVYGRIPALQDAGVGTYTDAITITVNY